MDFESYPVVFGLILCGAVVLAILICYCSFRECSKGLEDGPHSETENFGFTTDSPETRRARVISRNIYLRDRQQYTVQSTTHASISRTSSINSDSSSLSPEPPVRGEVDLPPSYESVMSSRREGMTNDTCNTEDEAISEDPPPPYEQPAENHDQNIQNQV